jgi:hypothetical protein
MIPFLTLVNNYKPTHTLIMKKILFVCVFIISTSGVFAQILATANSPEYRNVLKMSASLFTRNTFQMGYERFLNPNTSLYLAAGLNFRDTDYERNWGVRTEAQMRFHVYTIIKPKESHRLYFAPYLMNHYIETETRDYSGSAMTVWKSDTFNAFGGGMLFGWSFSFANRINLDMYTGGGFRKTFNYDVETNTNNNGVFDYGYSGIVPRLGIDIGFWF